MTGLRWIDLFPWAAKSVRIGNRESQNNDLERRWLRDLDPESIAFRPQLIELAQSALTGLDFWTMGELCSGIPESLPIQELQLKGIERNSSLLTLGTTFHAIADQNIWEIRNSANTLLNSPERFLVSLFEFAITHALHTQSSKLHITENQSVETIDSPQEDESLTWTSQFTGTSIPLSSRTAEELQREQAIFELVENVNTISRFLSNYQGQDRTFLKVELEGFLEVPSEIGHALNKIQHITPAKWLAASETHSHVAHMLSEFLESLPSREMRILEGRLLQDNPKTLDALGQEYGITRERVRQLEVQMNAQLSEWFVHNAEMQSHSLKVRNKVGNLTSLSSVLDEFPDLKDVVEVVDKPAWYVFDKFDDAFESDGTWIATPSLEYVSQEFDALFDNAKQEENYITLEDFYAIARSWSTTPAPRILDWCLSRNFLRTGDIVIGPSQHTTTSIAMAVLANASGPMTIQDLHAALPMERNIRALAGHLSEDDRFVRTSPETWALASRASHEYVGIKNEIRAIVERSGQASLAQLISELTTKFGVSEASIRTYASGWPFKLAGDTVTLATINVAPRRPFSQARRSYKLGEGIYSTRVEITREHLRGSGFSVPSGLAYAIGLVPGATKEFVHETVNGNFAMRWNAGQPLMSSIRPILIEMGATFYDDAVIVFNENKIKINILKHDVKDPLERARVLLSFETDSQPTIDDLSNRFDTSGLTGDEIRDLLCTRGEHSLAESLIEAGVLPRGPFVEVQSIWNSSYLL